MVGNESAPRRTYISQAQPLVNIGDTGQMRYITPKGYSKLAEILFDPDKDCAVTLQSQKSGKFNILEQFSTKIGSALGVIAPGLEQIENDPLTLTFTLNDAAVTPARVTFTLVFE
jgi:hypothetical protein